MTNEELLKPVSEVEIADAITVVNGMMLIPKEYEIILALQETRNIIRRMAFELDQLREKYAKIKAICKEHTGFGTDDFTFEPTPLDKISQIVEAFPRNADDVTLR